MLTFLNKYEKWKEGRIEWRKYLFYMNVNFLIKYLPGSKNTIAFKQENSWSFIWMSLSGLTIRSRIFPATLLISNSDLSLDMTQPLPSISVSVHRIERRAAPRIKFSPACVFNKAIFFQTCNLKNIYSEIKSYCKRLILYHRY